jgi:ketosteroid isomerase-like protein
VSPENPKSGDSPETAPNPELDAFFQRLPGNLHWPLPSEAAIAAAVEAVQRMAGSGAGADRQYSSDENLRDSAGSCASCGQMLANGMRFCGFCGRPVGEDVNGSSDASNEEVLPEAGPVQQSSQARAAQHHYHHHYHHFVGGTGPVAQPTQSEAGAPLGRATSSPVPGGRAAITARQVAQDWAQSCNTKHLDDLVDLYLPDATLLRPNVLPVRSVPSIREFLFAALEAGLGDIEMNSLRTEIFGEIALDLGRCKMLVPVAMGKRREERGKYLLVLARQPAGHWKIIADCWSTDLSVSPASSETARKTNDVTIKKPR